MVSHVAIVDIQEDVQETFKNALNLIGYNVPDMEDIPVVIKVGVFDHKKGHHHTTVDVVNAIIQHLDKTRRIYLIESDNYKGKGIDRLQIYKDTFSEKVIPFNLSEDKETKEVTIAGESIQFSHLLFKPNIFISAHVLRKTQIGSILKNLLGLIPDRRKARFHKKLVKALCDAYEAIGGIDLAVLDGTHMFRDPENPDDKGIRSNVLIIGKDAVAVETVGIKLCGLNPEEVPLLQEAVRRGLGEGNFENIKIVGDSLHARTY